MSVYNVTYDLNKAGQNYSGLIARLKEFPERSHYQDSAWLVATTWSAEQVRDYLLPFLDTNDSLLVAALTGETAWDGLGRDAENFLRERFTVAA